MSYANGDTGENPVLTPYQRIKERRERRMLILQYISTTVIVLFLSFALIIFAISAANRDERTERSITQLRELFISQACVIALSMEERTQENIDHCFASNPELSPNVPSSTPKE